MKQRRSHLESILDDPMVAPHKNQLVQQSLGF